MDISTGGAFLKAVSTRLPSLKLLTDPVDLDGYRHDETAYLRVHKANVRRKLEPEPSRPRYFFTEPGMGYRFEGGA